MNLIISLLQTDIEWESPQTNFDRLSALFDSLSDTTDIAVLPEMFATGFSVQSQAVAQQSDGMIVSWLKAQAMQKQICILAGVAIKDDAMDKAENRIVWVQPDGTVEFYAKRHLFRMAGEHKDYRAGTDRLILEYKGWRICPFVCYDLRFPVWSRNVDFSSTIPSYQYDCAIYIANWPKARQLHWSTLLQARSIENQAFVVGVNRVGVDANGYEYSGNSVVFSPLGTSLTAMEPSMEMVETVELSKTELETYRAKFPFVLDADPFSVQ